jgi:hypothetical protein
MQLRAGCKRMETVRCGKLAIVCQINKLRLLERNHRVEKVDGRDRLARSRPDRRGSVRSARPAGGRGYETGAMDMKGRLGCQGFNVHLRIGPGTSIPFGWMWFRASWHSSTLLKGTDKEM